ncbi:helix-turn-helix domain-containing protein [Evansella cellulosilytica]|uniref:Helix-turn-helix domain protein n=1 Tax=Evansella cellulosilytica (strain ATCC 21833 / DSM 2522 / FERM P-1141 / JCM 9156 / N-4) TaxID=649639 RepID=E6U1M0_EVAC2|nr:helix-turn-helix transcriptional regulator [Evansella cellulosilytica]ADU30383.1 helix-turn-helix domain protein [Evansella cellulosilytica DSM 2522]
MIKLKSKIGECIETRGLKIKFVADKLGVSREQVGKWKNGKAFPRIDKLFELALLLGVKVDDLYEVIDSSDTIENEEF